MASGGTRREYAQATAIMPGVGMGPILRMTTVRGLRTLLCADIDLQTLAYGETVVLNGVRVSLHLPGTYSAQRMRIEYGGQVWVASSNYKLQQTGRVRRSSRCGATFSSLSRHFHCRFIAGRRSPNYPL